MDRLLNIFWYIFHHGCFRQRCFADNVACEGARVLSINMRTMMMLSVPISASPPPPLLRFTGFYQHLFLFLYKYERNATRSSLKETGYRCSTPASQPAHVIAPSIKAVAFGTVFGELKSSKSIVSFFIFKKNMLYFFLNKKYLTLLTLTQRLSVVPVGWGSFAFSALSAG